MPYHRHVSHSSLLPAPASRQWSARLRLVLLVVVAIAVLVAASTQPIAVKTIRTALADAITPVMAVVSAPVNAVQNANNWLRDTLALRSQNRELKDEVAALSKWKIEANSLKAENKALRILMKSLPRGSSSYVASRIISESGGPFVHAALINGGKDKNIQLNQAVIGTEGLVGRVIEPGETSSRILLITDINSRVPVIAERSRERAILAGNNASLIGVEYVAGDTNLSIGELLVTSGDGGVFPPGIPVARVVEGKNNQLMARPVMDWSRMEYISIVSFSF